jgi:hypothetical protein
MTYNIIACGDTAKHWNGSGNSIGVNDSFKWGHHIDRLIVCNRLAMFPRERLDIINASQPNKFYSHKADWHERFPLWNKLDLVPWYGTYHKGKIYKSDTSPFIAICLAAKLGATEIVLWGVDFVNHSKFKHGEPGTKREVETYLELIRELDSIGIKVYLGSYGTAFDNYLPIYKLP